MSLLDPVVIPQEDALCDPLPTPRFAIQECTEDGMKVGTVCNFECDDGKSAFKFFPLSLVDLNALLNPVSEATCLFRSLPFRY